MERTIKLQVPLDNRIEDTVRLYNVSCNHCIRMGFELGTYNKTKLHRATYRNIRKQFPQLNSSFVCAARDQASDMLKREKLKRLPKKRKFSAIRFNHNTFKPFLESGVISMSTTFGRIKVPIEVPDHFKKYISWKISSATLHIKGGKAYFNLVAETDTPPKAKPTKAVGIDRGIINPVVTSDNKFFNSNHIRAVKGRYQWLRKRLQSTGTRSAKRKLKKISERERRFMRDVNHCISKEIAESDADLFVLEKLNIKRRKKNGKRFNTLLGTWSFRQFQEFLGYKAEALGKAIEYIKPRYTSQKCSRCGEVRKANRQRRWYRCRSCGFSINADLNAARNIVALSTSLGNRVPVNTPNVA